MRSATSIQLPGRRRHLTPAHLQPARTAVTVDLSMRLGEALSLSPDFFSKAQLQYDLWTESQKRRRKIKPLAA